MGADSERDGNVSLYFARSSCCHAPHRVDMVVFSNVFMSYHRRKRVPYSRAGGGGSRPNNSQAPSKPPPTGYVCYRCGQPGRSVVYCRGNTQSDPVVLGHWIQECPTNDDPNFENRPRAKRTTGIPRSFLQTVAEPAEGQSGLMIGTDGGYVIARPDA